MAKLEGFEYIVASKDNPREDLVSQFYENIAVYEFEENELEELSHWIATLKDGGASSRYILNIGILLRTADGVVVGGIVQELYRESRCALVSYVAVHECMRGKGCARFLMMKSFDNLRALCRKNFDEDIHAMFIEVVQNRDAEEHGDESLCGATPQSSYSTFSEQSPLSPPPWSGLSALSLQLEPPSPARRQNPAILPPPSHAFDPSLRQKIWARMGFLPLEFDLVHVGRMRGHRYNLAIWTKRYHDDVLKHRFPADVLRTFLHDFGTSLLENEGSSNFLELECYREVLQGRDYVGCGPEHWH